MKASCDIYALKVERLLLLLSSMPWFGEVDLWVPLALPHFTHLIDHKNIPAAAPKPNERAENKRQSSESSSESFLFLLRLAILLWWGKIWYDFTRRYLICMEGVSGSIHPACILRTISNNSNSVYIAINCHQSNGVGLALSCGHGDFWFWVSEKMTISVGLVWRAKIRKNVWVCRIYLRKIGKPTDMVAAAIKLLTTFNMDNI